MADYFSDPLWRRRPDGLAGVKVDLDELPLSDELKQRLRAWAARFDTLRHTHPEWPSEVEATFQADARVLLDDVRAELGPAYDVGYLGD